MQHLKDKVAVITGGNSGIGKATARLFAEEGAQVIISGRRQDAVDRAVQEIGPSAIGFVGDAADLEDHRRLADTVKSRFGGLDIYMANAGIINLTTSAEVTPADYDRHFAINTRGVFFGVQKIAPIMRDGGSIILTGSIASDRHLEGHAVYAGSKAAIVAFAQSWAIELKSRRIRVNVLSPGPVDTPILDKLGLPPESRALLEKNVSEAIPLGRLGEADELGNAALFLASDASSFITGINLRVDGGMSLL
jgi:NAD(P)-dependent dehydrogenase (short-subunit alcohol dehydrogenase family)